MDDQSSKRSCKTNIAKSVQLFCRQTKIYIKVESLASCRKKCFSIVSCFKLIKFIHTISIHHFDTFLYEIIRWILYLLSKIIKNYQFPGEMRNYFCFPISTALFLIIEESDLKGIPYGVRISRFIYFFVTN